jgi:peptide subunit release factor 1 (eRF1)
MFADIDLSKLSDISTAERSCLSVYLASPQSVHDLDRHLERVQRVLKREGEKSEAEHFAENAKLVKKYLDQNLISSGSLCLFSCWILDFFEVHSLSVQVADDLRVDSSPYIRPLAELQDDYEDVAVVVADNKKTRIFVVSSAVSGDEEVIAGNVKNHVRKGGWSQQRYERRRDKQLLLYAREIVAALKALDKTESFRRILFVGGKEILRIIYENLPHTLQKRACKKAIDLSKGEHVINRDIMALFTEQERQSEEELWEKIRAEYLCGGLAVVGLDPVLAAAKLGQIESLLVDRSFKPRGKRCRDCEQLDSSVGENCAQCGSASSFEVDLVNEVIELVTQSGGQVDMADPIDTLTQAGFIAALTRYKLY